MAVKARHGRGHGFAQVLEWSKYKHELLAKYLRVWCYKLGSQHHELAFVDTHAGAGKYGCVPRLVDNRAGASISITQHHVETLKPA